MPPADRPAPLAGKLIMAMKRIFLVVCALLLVSVLALAGTRPASHLSETALRQRVEAFLDRTIGWQQLDVLRVDSIGAPDASGLRKVKVFLKKGSQQLNKTFYVTADGREIIDGDVTPLSSDPFRSVREKLQLEGFPSQGPANAPVTLVEFSDLECPYCKQANQTIEQLRQQMPGKLRVIFKYYPLTKIHPWSMQAALAAVCVADQNPAHFWPFEQAVFDHQEQLTTANAATRLHDFALESGTQDAPFQSCLKSPATRAKVEASIKNGNEVGVESTPTLFLNGRIIPGAPDPNQLSLLLQHELKFAPEHGERASGELGGQIHGQQCGMCKPLPPLPKKP